MSPGDWPSGPCVGLCVSLDPGSGLLCSSRKHQETPSGASSPSLSSAATTDTEAPGGEEQETSVLGSVAEGPEEVALQQEEVTSR